MNKNVLRKNYSIPGGTYKKYGFVCWRYVFSGINLKTGENKTFFVEFFLINPARSPNEPVFGQLYEQKTKKYYPSYVMVKAGTWGKNGKQIHEFYPAGDLQFERNKSSMSLNSLYAGEDKLCGSVFMREQDVLLHPEYMSDAGTMSWDLTMQTEFSAVFGNVNWNVPGIKTRYKGKVVYNDEDFIVRPEKSFGYADKFWGRDFTSPLMYVASSNAVSDITARTLQDSCFAVGCGGSEKAEAQNLPCYTAVFFHDGVRYDFGSGMLHKRGKIKFDFREGAEELHWLIYAETSKYLFDVDIYCLKDEALFINYESPAGNKYHNRLWSCGNGTGEVKFFQKGSGKKLELIESIHIKNSFCEYGEYDTADFI